MAFRFNWKFFDIDELQEKSRHVLTESISKARRPPVMVTPTIVTGIDFGTQPPELAFHSIDYIGTDRAHIVFRLKYKGDASLSLSTNIEANPLREPYLHSGCPQFVKPQVVGALDSLVLPFRLKLHDFELETFVDVIYTPEGLVVNFRGEPVTNVAADSSLDSIPGVKGMIAEMVRPQLSEAFHEDIPETLWTASSPSRHPPDPFYGPRRWSQKDVTHIRFASLGSSLPPVWGNSSKKRMYDTLALRVVPIKHALVSRARLPASEDNETEMDPMQINNITALFEDASVTTSASSSSQFKPRRRVISLKSLKQFTNISPPTPDVEPKTPQMPPIEDESAVYDFSPLSPPRHPNSIRRYTSPNYRVSDDRGGREAFISKLRTSSLQETSKPQLSVPRTRTRLFSSQL